MISVFSARPATPLMASWIINILQPHIEACRFSNSAPSIEFRPMTVAGFASTFQTDSRVCISNRCVFWSKHSIVNTVFHEYTHQLIYQFKKIKNDIPIDGHGAVFFLVLMSLFKRIDSANKNNSMMLSLNLYDFQDIPDDWAEIESNHLLQWQTEVLNFALENHRELADSNLCAEDLTAAAYQKWMDYLFDCKSNETHNETEWGKYQCLKVENEELICKYKELNFGFNLSLSMTIGLTLLLFYKLFFS